jgi:hypothetical protein
MTRAVTPGRHGAGLFARLAAEVALGGLEPVPLLALNIIAAARAPAGA